MNTPDTNSADNHGSRNHRSSNNDTNSTPMTTSSPHESTVQWHQAPTPAESEFTDTEVSESLVPPTTDLRQGPHPVALTTPVAHGAGDGTADNATRSTWQPGSVPPPPSGAVPVPHPVPAPTHVAEVTERPTHPLMRITQALIGVVALATAAGLIGWDSTWWNNDAAVALGLVVSVGILVLGYGVVVLVTGRVSGSARRDHDAPKTQALRERRREEKALRRLTRHEQRRAARNARRG